MSKIDDARDVLIGLVFYIVGSILTIYILQWIVVKLLS
jgi:hypothetical protein